MKTPFKAFACFLALCLAFPAFAGSIAEYTADMVDVKTGKVTQKLAVAPDKIYAEIFAPEGKRISVTIIRLDQKKMYVCMENSKSYMELPFDKDKLTAADFTIGMAQARQEKVGTETVGGYQADKFRTTVQGLGTTRQFYQWMAPEFDPMPVRTEAEGDIREMRNIKTGRPDASLFEIPQGYERNEQMEQMMKGAMGGK